MTAFATVPEVQGRLDFTLDTLEVIAVGGFLDDLSEEARYHAGQLWPLATDPPNLVKTTLIRAIVRWAKNMNGYNVSRGGDEIVGWANLGPEAGTPEFSKREIKLLAGLGSGRTGPANFGTITVQAYGSRDGGWRGTLPVTGSPKDIPFYNTDTDGW